MRYALASVGVGACLAAVIGVLCGVGSALFLWLLDVATTYRVTHEWIVYALPLAGLVIGLLYERLGQPIKGGSNLVIDAIEQGDPVPLRMAPMVLIGTVLTHVFGGSAGREGTAVQMGTSLADVVARRARVAPSVRRQLLIAGVAGGFGSVFGTPLAGAVFGMEVAVVGRMQVVALVPALIASVVGDAVTRAFGIGHTDYPQLQHVDLSAALLGKWFAFAACVALVTVVFVELTEWIKRRGVLVMPRLPVRMFVGGLLVVVLWQAIGSSDYLGLGVPTIVRAFSDPQLAHEAFALKLLLTAITIGAGFLGGEVTPLFFVGATLGSVLARVLGIPLELAVGVGLASVFAAASNAPLALSVMALELLGVHVFPHVLIVSVIAFLLTGHRGIYAAQRFARTKTGKPLHPAVALRDWSRVVLQRRHSEPMPSNGPE